MGRGGGADEVHGQEGRCMGRRGGADEVHGQEGRCMGRRGGADEVHGAGVHLSPFPSVSSSLLPSFPFLSSRSSLSLSLYLLIPFQYSIPLIPDSRCTLDCQILGVANYIPAELVRCDRACDCNWADEVHGQEEGADNSLL